jgi:hypothetical protein
MCALFWIQHYIIAALHAHELEQCQGLSHDILLHVKSTPATIAMVTAIL